MDFARLPFARPEWQRVPLHRNVGREDRIVRACVALSLLLVAGFTVLLSGSLGAFSLLLVMLLGYFVGTAAIGWDPLYAWGGIDTRTDAELSMLEVWDDEPAWAPPQVVHDSTPDDAALEATASLDEDDAVPEVTRASA